MTFGATYAGQPVCLDHNGHLAELFADCWPNPGWLFSRGRTGGDASPFFAGGVSDRIRLPYPELPPMRLNEVIVPTGASRYARGLFVVDNVRLKEILYTCYGYTDASPTPLATLPTNWEAAWTSATLSIQQGGVTFSRQMHMLPPVLLDATGSNTLWLLPLVDQRYFWQQRGIEDADLGDAWLSLATALAGAASVSLGASPVIDADYGTFDSETFADWSMSLGDAIDAAALSTGRRAVFDGTYLTFQESAVADTARTANLSLAGIRLGGNSPGTIKAESPRVHCRYANEHWPDPDSGYELVPGINNVGASPERPSIRSTWYVEHFNSNVNAAALTAAQAFGDQLATDLLAWGNRQYIASFAGIAPWALSGHDDYSSIRIEEDESSGGAAAILRVASLPPDFRPTINLCQRPGIYIYPHETATGTLVGDLSPVGTATLTFDAVNSLYAGAPVQFSVAQSKSNGGNTITAGTAVFLTYQRGQGWTVVETAGKPSTPTWIDFELTSSVRWLGDADATVVSITGDTVYDVLGNEITVGSTVTVWDDNNLWRDLVPGCTGKARHRYVGSEPQESRFAIHSSTRPLNKVLARLADKLTASKDQIEVKPYHAVLSQPPFTTPGPEWNLAADECLLVANDWKLHSDSDNVVEMERVYLGLQVDDTDPEADPEATVDVYWRITRVLDPFPDMIVGALAADMDTSEVVTVNVAKEFNGILGATVQGHVLPGLVDANVGAHGVHGWKSGEPVVLSYQADEDKYYIIGTASAMLGRTKLTDITTDVINTGTAITRKKRTAVAVAGAIDPESTGTVIEFTSECP